jgi:hypothetical protein
MRARVIPESSLLRWDPFQISAWNSDTVLPGPGDFEKERDDFVAYLVQSEPLNRTVENRNARPYLGVSITGMTVGLLCGMAAILVKPDDTKKSVGEGSALLTGFAAGLLTFTRWDKKAGRAEQCVEFLNITSGAFYQRWPRRRAPNTHEDWSDFDKDKSAILETVRQLACKMKTPSLQGGAPPAQQPSP